jgi:hypothetical protein
MSSRTGPGRPGRGWWRPSAVASSPEWWVQLRPLGLHPRPSGYGNDPDRVLGVPAGRDRHVEEKIGDGAHVQITDRTQEALDGIPKTLAAIKRIAESTEAGEQAGS